MIVCLCVIVPLGTNVHTNQCVGGGTVISLQQVHRQRCGRGGLQCSGPPLLQRLLSAGGQGLVPDAAVTCVLVQIHPQFCAG